MLLAAVATLIGFFFGLLFGFVAGYFRNSAIDKIASFLSVVGVSVPHYWLGMVLVIIFSAQLNLLPPTGAGPGGSSEWRPDWEHIRHLILPAVTMSVIPMGIVARSSPISCRRTSCRRCAPRGSRSSAFSAMS